MLRGLFIGLIFSLLTGCAVFPRQETTSQTGFPKYDTTPVSAQEMQLLVPGEWYQVRLPEKDGHSLMVRGIFHNGYVGRLQACDENSLTLTDVTKCTLFDSTSALRRLPLVGSSFEYCLESCKNESAPVTIRRTQLMWFNRITAEKADLFRRYHEITNTPFEIAENNDSSSQNTPFGVLDVHLPDTSFLLPNPQREEKLSQRRIEILEMPAGQWYFVYTPWQGQGSSKTMKMHFGLVQQVDRDSITLTDVTTQCVSEAERGVVAIETSAELTVPRSQIENVRQIPPDEVAEWIAEINQPREPMLSEGK